MKKFFSVVTFSLIFILGAILAGCDSAGGSLTLSFSSPTINLTMAEENQEYTITVNEMQEDSNISFDFRFEERLAVVVDNSLTYIGAGKYTLKIAPKMTGTTNLTITIRGTDTKIEIPVYISETIQSLTARSDVFVKRGESIKISVADFNFNPQDTSQTALAFSLKNEEELSGMGISWLSDTLYVDEELSVLNDINEVIIVATSLFDTLITAELRVKIVNQIDLSKLSVTMYSQDLDNPSNFDADSIESLYPFEEEGISKIELTLNDNTNFQKLVSVGYEFESERAFYKIDAYADEGLTGEIANGAPIVGREEEFSFIVQANSITQPDSPFYLTFKIYQADFISNYEVVKIPVYVNILPKELRINGQSNIDTVELYDNSQEIFNFRFALFPSVEGAYNGQDYHYSIETYSAVITSGEEPTYMERSTFLEYVEVYYGNKSLYDYTAIDLLTLDSLNEILRVKSIMAYENYLVLTISCLDNSNNVICSNNIYFKVYKGTTTFTINPTYEDSTIYIPMSRGTEKTVRFFSGFMTDENSTVGRLNITGLSLNGSVCDVEQDFSSPAYYQTPMLKITANKVGRTEFRLETQTGLRTFLTVVVVREITIEDFQLQIAEDSGNNVSEFTVDPELNNSVNSIVFKGIGSKVKLNEKILNYRDADEMSFGLTVQSRDEDYFVVDDGVITAKNFTEDDEDVTIEVVLTIYKANSAFSLDVLTTKHYDIAVKCIDYIKILQITTSHDELVDDILDNTRKVKHLSVYNKNDLSYMNQNLSEAFIYLDATLSGSVVHNMGELSSSNLAITIDNWRIPATDFGHMNDDGKYPVGTLGYFELGGEDDVYIAKFVCDITGIRIIDTFSISLRLTDKTGSSYVSEITINIDNYIDVDNLYMVNGRTDIYLDNTEEYNEVNLSFYVMPTDAMMQDIRVFIEYKTGSNCLLCTQNGNNLTFTYISGGSGIIRIFPVSKMKSSNVKDNYGNYYYHIALPFVCADGQTEQSALKISDYRGIVSMLADRHYYIDRNIDCGGEEIKLQNFNGTLRGTFLSELDEDFGSAVQIGSISNFKVVNSGRQNSGMFETIGSEAKIYNLAISGMFDSEESWVIETLEADIGLLCGVNYGLIRDVTVSLYGEQTSPLEINSESLNAVPVYIGLVAGKNVADIQITDKLINSTLLIDMNNKFTVIQSGSTNLYVGGVCGINAGEGRIKNLFSSATLVSVGLFGINVNASIESNATYLGGVVGKNGSTDGDVALISNIKAVGTVVNSSASAESFVGGFLGDYSYGQVENNISRVYVRGSGNVCGFVGSVSELADITNVMYNKVQATDNGTRKGIDISLIVRYGDTYEKLYAFATRNFDESNKVESYVTRTLRNDSNLRVDPNLNIDFYYGDFAVILYDDGGDFYTTVYGGEFEKEAEERINGGSIISSIVLAVYKKAKNANDQVKIENSMHTLELLKLANISAKEITVETDNIGLANFTNYSSLLKFGGLGSFNLTIYSSLNYKNNASIKVYITTYFDDFRAYTDKNKVITTSNIQLINNKVKTLFVNAYSDIYNYQNTPVYLQNNTEITFEGYVYKDGILVDDIVEVRVAGQTLFLKSLVDSDEDLLIKIHPVLILEGSVLYGVYVEELGFYKFSANIAESYSVPYAISTVTGIDNIEIDKYNIAAEPTDTIQMSISYNLYSNDDIIQITPYINNEMYSIEDTVDPNLSYITDSNGYRLFKLIKLDSSVDGIKHFETYQIRMIVTSYNYRWLKDCALKLFVHSLKIFEGEYLTIDYTPETITSVLINNYNYEENLYMRNNLNKNQFIASEMINTSNFASSGEMNVLRTYIYTQLSEFEYVDITMNSGVSGGYLALAEKIIEDNKTYYNISYKVVYTSVDGVLTLRIYRADIINESIYDTETATAERTLDLAIIYSLPASINQGTYVPIDMYFYKTENGQPKLCYYKGITVIAKSTKKVEFELYGKDPEPSDTLGVNAVYSVAKGKNYAVVTNIVGFNKDEVFFNSSDANVASISDIGGVYYLNISNINIDYRENPYYEVLITSFGRKIENNVLTQSANFVVSLRVYEVLLDNENLFVDDNISLRLLSAVDIKEVISNKISMEYESDSLRQQFLNSFKELSTFYFDINGRRIEINDGLSDDGAINYLFKNGIFTPKAIFDSAPYEFEVKYDYIYKNGVPTCDLTNVESNSIYRIYTGSAVFNVRVYMNSSEKVPMPINSYEKLKLVEDDEYYRLVSDITIKGNEFETIKTTPRMLDGNGYSIIITGNTIGTNVENVNNFALFETIKSGSVFKNINIVVSNTHTTLTINNNYTMNANIGILCATNNGLITNCCVKGGGLLEVSVITSVTAMENTYFGAIAAVNNGYVTNSRVTASMSLNGGSLGGFVANNNGQISSCYVKEAKIMNKTSRANDNIVTGGFVCNNSGKISMCYIEGHISDKVYCYYNADSESTASKNIYSSLATAGFVYQNDGIITDSYSNIPIDSSSKCAGFVGINNNSISRVYSLSRMRVNDTLNYAFVISEGEKSSFEDCYFAIVDGVINYYTSETNYQKDVNSNVYTSRIPGVNPISLYDFSLVDKHGEVKNNGLFSNFLINKENGLLTDAVWFYVNDIPTLNDAGLTDQKMKNGQTYSAVCEGFDIYDFETERFEKTGFVAGRLQLVSPNIIANSRYSLNLDNNTTIEDGKYSYSSDDAKIAYGSQYNPYLISTAVEFEDYCNQGNMGILEYYRLICDIDYTQERVYNTKLYDRTLIAHFEGNNFNISNYSVNSSSSINSGGLLAGIGQTSTTVSVFKNITLKPYYVNLPNAIFVGALAGTLTNANVYNVNVEGQNVIVTGSNILGGVFGRTAGVTDVRNVFANVIVKSTQYGSVLIDNKEDVGGLAKNLSYNETTVNKTSVSYSGGIIGYVGGMADISVVAVGEDSRSYGVVAGLLFGGVGASACVHDIDVELNSFNNEIQAMAFGGIITGENRGTIQDITINSDILNKTLFKTNPICPIAIGGVAGLMNGGIIKNVSSEKGYDVIGASFTGVYANELINGFVTDSINNPYVVKYVGGIVGYYTYGYIETINIGHHDEEHEENCTGLIICGSNYVGVIVGYMDIAPGTSALSSSIISGDISINLTSHKKYINSNGTELDEFVYTSYVSEASVNMNNNFIFDNSLYFGLITSIVKSDETTFSNVTISGAATITISKKVYFYYADYSITEAKVFTFSKYTTQNTINNSINIISGGAYYDGKYEVKTINLQGLPIN